MASSAAGVVACCLVATAVALIGVVTLAGGGTGTVPQILSGESSVESAWVSITESAKPGTNATIAGPYSFESKVGRFEDKTGTYQGSSYISGKVTLVSAVLLWRTMQQVPGSPPIPFPRKPWVSEPTGSPDGGAIGDILLGSQLQATPAELVGALERQVSSITSLGFVAVDGRPAHKYRLVLRLDGLAKAIDQAGGQIQALGMDHPVFIWVDIDNRLVRLLTSIGYESPRQTITISVTYSRFNIHVAVALPPDASTETLHQYRVQIDRAWGCPPQGGVCKNIGGRRTKPQATTTS